MRFYGIINPLVELRDYLKLYSRTFDDKNGRISYQGASQLRTFVWGAVTKASSMHALEVRRIILLSGRGGCAKKSSVKLVII